MMTIGFVIGLLGGEMMIGDGLLALIGEKGGVLIIAMVLVVVIALVPIAESVQVLIMVVAVAVLLMERRESLLVVEVVRVLMEGTGSLDMAVAVAGVLMEGIGDLILVEAVGVLLEETGNLNMPVVVAGVLMEGKGELILVVAVEVLLETENLTMAVVAVLTEGEGKLPMMWFRVQVLQMGGREFPNMAMDVSLVLKERWLTLNLFVGLSQKRGLLPSMIMATVQVLQQRSLVLMVTIVKLAQMPSLKLGTVPDTVEEIAPCMSDTVGKQGGV